MASFEIVDIDYNQTGFGELHAVPELKAQLPRTAKLMRRFAGADRGDYFSAIFSQPVKYHPSPQFDWSRAQPEFIAADETGQFLWIPTIIVASLIAGTQLHTGMKGFQVNLAYVIDNTIGLDGGDQLDFSGCDSVGWASINDVTEPPPPATVVEMQER